MLRQLTRLATSFKSFQLNQVGRNSARLSLLVHHGACIEIVVNVPDLFHLVYAPGNPLRIFKMPSDYRNAAYLRFSQCGNLKSKHGWRVN